jgi:hypothetical protein
MNDTSNGLYNLFIWLWSIWSNLRLLGLSNGSGLFSNWGGGGARRGSIGGNGVQPKVRDITERFLEAARGTTHSSWMGQVKKADDSGIELKTGELVQDPNFTLLEAVGALEVSGENL